MEYGTKSTFRFVSNAVVCALNCRLNVYKLIEEGLIICVQDKAEESLSLMYLLNIGIGQAYTGSQNYPSLTSAEQTGNRCNRMITEAKRISYAK